LVFALLPVFILSHGWGQAIFLSEGQSVTVSSTVRDPVPVFGEGNNTVVIDPSGSLIVTDPAGFGVFIAGGDDGFTTVINNGLIGQQGNGELVAGIQILEECQVINRGTIQLSGPQAVGILFATGQIQNTGLIDVSGPQSVGVFNIGPCGCEPASSTLIQNSGTLRVNGVGIFSFGDTVIENSGLIDVSQTTDTSVLPMCGCEPPFPGTAFAIFGVNGDDVVINTGTIRGAPGSTVVKLGVDSDDDPALAFSPFSFLPDESVLDNDVLINGALPVGATLQNPAPLSFIIAAPGQTAVDMGPGMDLVVLNSTSVIQGLIDGGSGVDTLRLVFPGLPVAVLRQLRSNPNQASFLYRGNRVDYTSFEIIDLTQAFSYQELLAPAFAGFGRSLDNVDVNADPRVLGLLQTFDGNLPRVNNFAAQLAPVTDGAKSQVGINNATFLFESLSQFSPAWNSPTPNGVVFDSSRLNLEDLELHRMLASTDRLLANASLHFQATDLAEMLPTGISAPDHSKELLEAPKDMLQPERAKWAVFAAGSGIFADAGQDTLADPGVDATTAGVLVGIDYRVFSDVSIGVFGGYNSTNLDFGSFAESDVDLYSVGTRVMYRPSQVPGLNASAIFSYGWNDYQQDRYIRLPGASLTAASSPDGTQYQAGGRAGYDWNLGHLTIGPYAGVQYVNWELDSYQESGAGLLNLSVSEQSNDSLKSMLGSKFGGSWSVAPKVHLTAELRAAWLHEFLDDSRQIVSSLATPALSPFGISTNDPDRNSALLGATVMARFCDHFTAVLAYDAQVGQSDYTGQQITGGLKVEY
jgi:uncharacterized protein YhjY with autotransporter beta-barrel domain